MTTPAHDYLATACLHDRHADCRYFCKWCPAPCQCSCHEDEEGPYPGFTASAENELRQALREEILSRGIADGPRNATLLVDIVTSILSRINKEQGNSS